MADLTDEDRIGGYRLDTLYAHDFRNKGGRYFNVVVEEDGATTVEYEEPEYMKNRLKISVRFIASKGDIDQVTIRKFKLYKNDGWVEQHFGGGYGPLALSHFSMEKLVGFLHQLSSLDLAGVNERRTPLALADPTGISSDTEAALRTLLLQPQGKSLVEELVRSGQITPRDIINITYRKEQLATFKRMMREEEFVRAYAEANGVRLDQPEKAWQHFFKSNEWIFGYGLDYRFMDLVMAEAQVGMADVSGRGGVTTDFLMGFTNFTVLVEVKLPGTHLFSGVQQRTKAWRLSTDLMDSVSQILEQKASWQVKSQATAADGFDASGRLVRRRTLDPKSILIVGSDRMFAGKDERETELKLRTFELFRRDSRNIEIITYDELFERAKFIVEQGEHSDGIAPDEPYEAPEAPGFDPYSDDIPF